MTTSSDTKCVFVFDTETTGLLKNRPFIVSIAYQIYSKSESNVSLVHKGYHVIKPPTDTYEIPVEAIRVHNITTKFARKYGITYKSLAKELHRVFTTYDIGTIVAHNMQFDMGVLSLNLNRIIRSSVGGDHNTDYITELLTILGNSDFYCTQEEGK